MNKFMPGRIILRSAEGEGGGGGGPEGGSDATANPVDRLERRLEQLTTVVGGLIDQTKRDKATTSLSQKEREVEAAVSEAEAEIQRAEQAVAEAYDSGEGVDIAKANRRMAEAIAQRENAKAEKREFDALKAQAERRSGGSSGAPGQEGGEKLDTTNLTAWKKKHASWYGVDDEMTSAAHGIDRQIRAAGVIPVGSSEYFEAIDRQMRQKFPDRMARTPDNEGGRGAGQGDARRGGRIPASVAEGYRRMGINIDDPKVAERMVRNREIAVQKGMLPSEPVTGRIITR